MLDGGSAVEIMLSLEIPHETIIFLTGPSPQQSEGDDAKANQYLPHTVAAIILTLYINKMQLSSSGLYYVIELLKFVALYGDCTG